MNRTLTVRPLVLALALIGGLAACAPARAQIAQENVLLLWNSTKPDSQAVRDMYIAQYPGVVEFDLANNAIPTTSVNRTQFVNLIRGPVRDFINGDSGGPDLSQQIMGIVMTRGLPSRVVGSSEFEIFSSFASVDSELSLVQQDLEAAGGGLLPFRYNGQVDHPYHTDLNQSVVGQSRAIVKIAKNFIIQSPAGGFSTWVASPFTPGEMYLVTRLDAAPNDAGSEVEHIGALLRRSKRMVVVREHVQALLDEFPASAGQLDDDGIPPIYPNTDDFDSTFSALTGLGIATLHDETNDFITGPELADQCRPLIVLGSYGENHDIAPGAENAPGAGVYINDYKFHPAAMAITYESFNGNSIVNGQQRQDHQQVLEMISSGGGFTIAHVNEPFTYAVADLGPLVRNMLQFGLTYAEAAYTSIPALSWVNVAVGDGLARVVLLSEADLDLNGDTGLDVEDLYAYHAAPLDLNDDGVADVHDAEIARDELRFGEACNDVTVAD